MNRTTYVLGIYNSISYATLVDVKTYLTKEELMELDRKFVEVSTCMAFKGAESLALAEKMFTLGYLCAHIEYENSTR